MKKCFLTIILSLLTVFGCSQNNLVPTEFNFGFERNLQNQKLPDGWFQWGSNYQLEIDTTIVHNGRKSILIQPADIRTKGSFGCVAYMKLQDVSDGPIGLLLRIDGSSGTLEFDNMQQRNIMGSKDWTSYSVKLPYPEGANGIYFGAMLSGNGRLWVDDFEVLIDGVPIEKVMQVQVKEYNADIDREFDKGSGINHFNPKGG